jgi:hypothetical protein
MSCYHPALIPGELLSIGVRMIFAENRVVKAYSVLTAE